MNITLDSGIEIILCEFEQSLTYEGLIEGLPTQEMNTKHIRNVIKWHSTSSQNPHLIEPVESIIDIGERYPFGTPAKIPRVTCVARFQSRYTKQEPILYRSTAKVIWFQEEFALPIEKAVLVQIRSIDWAVISTDYEL